MTGTKDGISDEEAEKRRRIELAAPELLKCLKELCSSNWDKSSYERADAAIAKAEGRA